MKPFENIVRKGENAGQQQFLLFLTTFLTLCNPMHITVYYLDWGGGGTTKKHRGGAYMKWPQLELNPLPDNKL